MAGILILGYAVATSAFPDGFVGAPTGSAPLPNILNGYVTRPPWHVSGVDYNVGPNSGTSFKDPASASLPSGVTRNTSPFNYLLVTGNNVTLDSYDLSAAGGDWRIEVQGSGCTVSNCKALITTNMTGQALILLDASATNFSLLNGKFDMNFLSSGATSRILNVQISNGTGSTTTVHYNYFLNTSEDCVSLGAGSGNMGAFDYRFNAIKDSGLDINGHADYIQTLAGNVIEFLQYDWNLSYQTTQGNNTQTVGYNAKQNPSAVEIRGFSFTFNTAIALSSTFVSPMFVYDHTELNGTGTIGTTYFDPTGIQVNGSGNGKLFLDDNGGHSFNGTVNISTTSINMTNGSTVQNWP